MGPFAVSFIHPLRERKSGFDIRHPNEFIAKDAPRDLLSISRVRKGKDGISMRMVNIGLVHKSMEEHFNRRARSFWLKHTIANVIDHRFIRHLRALEKMLQIF